MTENKPCLEGKEHEWKEDSSSSSICIHCKRLRDNETGYINYNQ